MWALVTGPRRRLTHGVRSLELPALLLIAPFLLFPTPARLIVLAVMPVIWLSLVASGEPIVPPTPLEPITLLMLLHAFAGGSVALTGVEAIANGVPAFKPPESKNAANTMSTMGLLLGVIFIGLAIVGVAAAGLAVAAGAPPFVRAVSLGAAGVWFAGLVVSAGFR
mgnify:CR=1 FL=1